MNDDATACEDVNECGLGMTSGLILINFRLLKVDAVLDHVRIRLAVIAVVEDVRLDLMDSEDDAWTLTNATDDHVELERVVSTVQVVTVVLAQGKISISVNKVHNCICSGFADSGDGNCGDINECNVNDGTCSDGCSNFEGGYSCGCQRGAFKVGNRYVYLTCLSLLISLSLVIASVPKAASSNSFHRVTAVPAITR